MKTIVFFFLMASTAQVCNASEFVNRYIRENNRLLGIGELRINPDQTVTLIDSRYTGNTDEAVLASPQRKVVDQVTLKTSESCGLLTGSLMETRYRLKSLEPGAATFDVSEYHGGKADTPITVTLRPYKLEEGHLTGRLLPLDQYQSKTQDQLCHLLFDQYFYQGKHGYSGHPAAEQLLAERGRSNGFWVQILKALRGCDNRFLSAAYVRILGEMLATDANMRDALRNAIEKGERGQSPSLGVCLGLGVVEELLARARQANGALLDDIMLALIKARVPETKDFFREIFQKNTKSNSWSASKAFYAAAGLAQLGDAEGVEWLIKNCEDHNSSIFGPCPYGAVSLNLSACSQAVLSSIAGEQKLTTQKQWEDWWRTAPKPFQPKGYVIFKSAF